MKDSAIIWGVITCLSLGVSGKIIFNKVTEERYYQVLKVKEVTRCLGDDRYDMFCTVKATKENGGVISARVNDLVYEGQTLYRHCWEEDKENRCYVDLRTYKSKGEKR